MGKTGERIFATCANVCIKHRWLVVLASILLTVLAAWYSSFLTINTSTDGVLSDQLEFRKVEKEYRAQFPKEESALVIIDAPTPRDADSAADNLAVRLSARSDLFSHVRVPGNSSFFTDNGILYLGVDPLTNFLATLDKSASPLRLFSQDASLRGVATLISDPQAGSGQADSAEAARLFAELGETARARAEGDQDKQANWVNIFGIQRPEGRPGTRRFVLALPVLDNSSLDRAKPAIEALREEIAGMESEEAEGVKTQITGDPVLRQQELSDAFSGAVTASALSFVLVALSLVLGIRSFRLIAILLVTLTIGGIWTTGLATLFVGRLNLISVAFMVLFLGLGVDFGTHLGLRFMEGLKKGASFADSMRTAMVGEAPSIGLSTLCAIVAFLSFVPTTYTGLAEFGIISALGMVVAFVMTFTVQPALMAVLPPKVSRWEAPEFGIGKWIKGHYRGILIVSALVTVGALVAATGARVDTNPLNLQNPKAEPVVAFRSLAHDPQTSPYSVNVIASDLEDAHARASRLAQLPGVAHVATAEDFLPKQQTEKLGLIEATKTNLGTEFFDTGNVLQPPDSAALSAAFTQLQEAAAGIAASSPEGSDVQRSAVLLRDGLNSFAEKRGTGPEQLAEIQSALVGSLPQIVSALRERLAAARILTVDDLPDDIRKDWISPQGGIRLQVQPADDIGSPEGMEKFATTIKQVEPRASGAPISITDAGSAILKSFLEAIIYTVIAIGLIVILLRRRVSDVLLVLAPLAVASIWTVACSALFNLPFNFANVIVIPLLIGLGVAGSIHIVVRARELEHEQVAGAEPIDVFETSTSLAVLVTQLNNVAAFATLAISHHRGLYSMGMLLGLAILLVVIVCLVVLPAAMMALDRRRRLRHV
ncbi:MMPL family transporter [Terrihabitans sp. B22-R8]|uniref:MMPL family transporter n=1 Tax=Terrihabitans sp. B22-R8 TaxID=3425128 RepID=UPI00403D0798